MNRKKLKILGVILAFVLSFPLHFLYDKFPCFFTSIFAPVSESIWEHMKILFGSIIISGVIQKIIVKIRKMNIENVCFSNFVAAISSIPIFLIMYMPVYRILGENLIVTIIIMLIAIIIAEVISYKIMGKKSFGLENKTIVFVIIIYMIFAFLTYYPLDNDLFTSSVNQLYKYFLENF